MPFALSDLVDSIHEVLGSAHEARGLKLTMEVERADATIVGDRRLLLRALQNLLQNALRHAPDASEIFCRFSEAPGARLEVEIRNEIASAEHQTASEVSLQTRTGLGHRIIRSILTLHGSVLKVGMEQDGKYVSRILATEAIPHEAKETKAAKRPTLETKALLPALCAAFLLCLLVGSLLLVSSISYRALCLFLVVTFSLSRLFSHSAKRGTTWAWFSMESLTVILSVVLLFLRSIDPRVQILQAASMSSLLFLFSQHATLLSPARKYLGSVLLSVGLLTAFGESSLVYLGLAISLSTTGILWTVESMGYARRAGSWLTGVFISGMLLASAVFHYGEFRGFIGSLRTQAQSTLGEIRPALEAKQDKESEIVEYLTRAAWSLPIIDYAVFARGEELGPMVSVQHAATIHRLRPADPNRQKLLIPFFSCSDLSCPGMFAGTPSSYSHNLLHVLLRRLASVLLPSEVVLLMLFISASLYPLRREIGRRFAILDEYLHRVRSGDYSQPKPFDAGDAFGELVSEVGSWCEELGRIRTEQTERRVQVESFLREASIVLQTNHDSLLRSFRSDQVSGAQECSPEFLHGIKLFRERAELVLVALVALLDFGDSPEPLSLPDMLLEEGERIGATCDFQELIRGKDIQVHAPVRLVQALVRSLFFITEEFALTGSSTQFRISSHGGSDRIVLLYDGQASSLQGFHRHLLELFRSRLERWGLLLTSTQEPRKRTLEIAVRATRGIP